MASIRKRGNSFTVTVSNGYRADGTQIRVSTSFTPDPTKTDRQNKKELEKFAVAFEERVKKGKMHSHAKLTYLEFSKIWLEESSKKVDSPTTYERNEIALRKNILPALGHMKLTEITPLDIQRFINDLEKNGYVKYGKKKSYSPSSIHRIHQVLSSSFSTAIDWNMIETNPCSHTKLPKKQTSKKRKYFSEAETAAFFGELDRPYTVVHGGRPRKKNAEGEPNYDVKTIPVKYKVFFYLALLTGFRRGELVALTWDDVDFINNTVDVTKAIAQTSQGTVIKIPKSETSIRNLNIPVQMIELLRQWKEEQTTYSLAVGSYWEGNNHIFTQDNGKCMDVSTPNKVLKKIIKRYNQKYPDAPLPEITLHGLRHTNATLLIAHHVDMKTVSARLGHSEISTTMNIYTHALKESDRKSSETLGALFFPKTEAK